MHASNVSLHRNIAEDNKRKKGDRYLNNIIPTIMNICHIYIFMKKN